MDYINLLDWVPPFAMFLSSAGLILWFRAESRNDWRHMDAKLDAMRQTIDAIQEEIKDFHGRLCAIEERNRGK